MMELPLGAARASTSESSAMVAACAGEMPEA